MQKGKLYLIPVSLGEVAWERYQPASNVQIMERLTTFIVENARSARHYIKSVLPNAVISQLKIFEVDKHDGYTFPEEIIALLLSGTDVGMMSEAGCPAVADPGALVVKRAHQEGIEVVPLVGPSSILLSLMASGFSGQRFSFVGYLPIDDQARKTQLSDMVHRVHSLGETQIFIETPYRNEKLVQELCRLLPATTKLCIAVDLTTPQESVQVQSIASWKKRLTSLGLHKRPAIFLLGQ